MSDDRTFERNARAWLELGPTDAPDRVVEAALLEIEATPQERDFRVPWRLPTMNPFTRMAVLASVVIVVAIGGIYLLGQATPLSGGQPSPAPSASPATTAPLMAGPLQFGTYFGPTFQVSDLIAQLNADADLTAAERTQFIDDLAGIRGKTAWSASIEIRGGQWTQRQTVDGSTQIGSIARYTFPNDQTVVLVETINGVESTSRFALTVSGDSFTLRSLTPPVAALDKFVIKVLYESGAFALKP
jgi:hypothetical protein